MDYIKQNLDEVLGSINNSANKANVNPDDIILIGVTKTVDIPIIEEAIRLGITHVGENKPQELVRKYEVIGDKVKWHLIGSLQTNKVKYIIDKADMIHSLDRISLCEEINKRAKNINKVMDCLVQVNISKEDTKHGLYKEDVLDFIKTVSSDYKNIKINGIMTMAPYVDNPEDVRIYFKEIKKISEEIEKLNLENVEMNYLSMGMSNDYKIAIEEGSNMVRVGTSIFGKRNYMK
ncbi:YggS family pyridoxal phosphate-dependent enzyme [Tepidibacter aestuarii]|uniref:YggS family pyridoxal phosphate-dependent enzyme n=1 Tax=Tepidibacter aestuarii TaxID=2925782 RepID=UPI0020C11298|nr:YggS family pyridoxal phosphate-dependent enzyme [Tepidibacter aestuarii]CAH2212773.1 putative PLP-containing enzyme [Tepidibacter aestuarii]